VALPRAPETAHSVHEMIPANPLKTTSPNPPEMTPNPLETTPNPPGTALPNLRCRNPRRLRAPKCGLPDHYPSAEIERRVGDEYEIPTSQSGTISTSYQSNDNTTKRSRTPIPGQPYCDNCKNPGHWTRDCYSKGGANNRQSRQNKD